MDRIERVSLIGLGAVGCTYLSKIADAVPMENIRVVAAGKRARRLENDGVLVNGKRYRFPVSHPGERTPPADLLLFGVKFSQLTEAIREAKDHVGPHTVVLSLLNGITSEQIIGASYGMDKILYSLLMGTDATRDDRGVRYTATGHIPFGEARNDPDHPTERVRRVADLFERSGIAYKIPADMILALWNKFMLNCGVNQTSAVLRAPYGILQQVPEVQELAVSAMREVAALARREGLQLGEEDINGCIAVMHTLSPIAKTSMLQDVEAGRQTEVAIFGETVVQLGEKHSIPVPVNEMLARIIRATDAKARFEAQTPGNRPSLA